MTSRATSRPQAPRLPFAIQLGDSPWPRSGGDARNRSRMPVEGPAHGRILARVRLPHAEPKVPVGLCVGSDGDLRAAYGGRLARITPDGSIVWSRVLTTSKKWRANAPVALTQGRTLVTFGSGPAIIVDAAGRILARLHAGDAVLDDSGPAPQVTPAGELLLTAMTGEVLRVSTRGCEEVGCFGYDIVSPALEPDGALVISGYAGAGLVRVRADGGRRRYPLKDPDLLPVVNAQGVIAAGSLNAGVSSFFTRGGRLLGTYAHPASFADAGGGRWWALWKGGVACVESSGRTRWERTWTEEAKFRWGALQPLVAPRGHVYVPSPRGVLALDAHGAELFQVKLPTLVTALAPVRAGLLAAATASGLLVLIE